MRRPYGIVELGTHYLEPKNRDELRRILDGFLVLHVETDWSRPVVRFYGEHPSFIEIDQGMKAPVYTLKVTPTTVEWIL